MASIETAPARNWSVPGVDIRTSAGRLLLVAASALVVLAAARFLVVIPYGRAIADFVFVLDGAYRISLGQLPHVDFQSPIGSLTLYLTFWAEQLFPNGNPFVGLHALAWLAMLPAVAMLSPKFRTLTGFAVALLLLALMVLVPVTLDSTHLSEISYFASYNRFATGLLFLVGLWLVLPKSRHDGLLLGYILVVLFFLKITAALVALGIIVAAVLLGRAMLRSLALAFSVLVFALVAVEASTGLVSGYLGGTQAMAAVNQGRSIYALAFAAFRNWMPLAALAAVIGVALWAAATSGALSLRRPVASLRALLGTQSFAVDAALLTGAALLAESQNTGGLGLIAASAILFHSQAWTADRLRGYAAALLLATLVLPVADAVVKRSFTAVTRERVAAADPLIGDLLPGTRVPVATAAGARLFDQMSTDLPNAMREAQDAGFFVDPDPTSYAPASRLAWVNSVVEAAHAFEAAGYRTTARGYVTLDFADPFARLLHLVPARGTTIAAEIGRTMPLFDEAQASRYLAQADGVFVPLCQIGGGQNNDSVFAAVLASEFEALPLQRCWSFYRRVHPAAVGG